MGNNPRSPRVETYSIHIIPLHFTLGISVLEGGGCVAFQECEPLAWCWNSIVSDKQTPWADLTSLLSQIPSQRLITFSWHQNSWARQLEGRHTDVAGWSSRGSELSFTLSSQTLSVDHGVRCFPLPMWVGRAVLPGHFHPLAQCVKQYTEALLCLQFEVLWGGGAQIFGISSAKYIRHGTLTTLYHPPLIRGPHI